MAITAVIFFIIHNVIKFLEKKSPENLIITANKLVHFGWKKEAIPVSRVKKSRIANFFDKIFSNF